MKRNAEGHEDYGLYLSGDKPTLYRKQGVRTKTVLTISAVTILLVLISLSIWGYLWLKSKEAKMHLPSVDSSLDKAIGGKPVNTLIMGIDKGSVPGEEGEGRSDIMLLVSVDKKNGKAAVISIPRDTRVRIPGYSGYNKINAAFALGGARLAIETVREFTGLTVNHYVILDFQGFKEIVDALGGVPMHVDVAIHDKYAGDVPAGDIVLNGDQALSFVRARHDPRAVPAGDLDRVKNQRKFLQAMLSAASHTRNPFKIVRLVDAVSKSARTDLSFFSMLSLGRSLHGSKEKVKMATAPGYPKVIGGIWYYIIDESGFKDMLASFSSKTEVEPEEASSAKSKEVRSSRSGIKVLVLNGARVTGLASSVAEELKKAGYLDVRIGNAQSSYSKTTIYYGSGKSQEAGLVAADLKGAAEPILEENEELVSEEGCDVLVVLGKDYEKP